MPGANVAFGGGIPEGFDKGWFVDQTVFRDVDNSMTISQEEIFGPVISVIKYEDDDDALRIADDSPLRLAGSVWTADVDRGYQMASQIRSGCLGVNVHTLDSAAPLGGNKKSGLGCEFGLEGVYEYVNFRSVLIPKESSELHAAYFV